jgi:D-3-phosphoglycerate dehydrogenase
MSAEGMKYKILNTIGEIYTSEAKKILSQLGDVDYVSMEQDQLKDRIGQYDILVIGLGLVFNREVLERANRLKVIATATTGFDHIDVEYAKLHDISIISLRGEKDFLNTITGTSELAFGLMIDLMRKTPWAFDAVRRYEWNRNAFRGRNLYGKTLGVVGIGRLGSWMARYARAFNMDVLFFDPKVEISPVAGCQKTTFDDLLTESDVVSVHVHLTRDTENMFNSAVFSKMKKGSYLVNTSRGRIVNERDLLDAVEQGQIAGYAADVLADELQFVNGFSEHPLVEYARTHDNVLIVPHIGGMTHESRERTDIFIAEKLKQHLCA